jgi:hypothetical protein
MKGAIKHRWIATIVAGEDRLDANTIEIPAQAGIW